jgi:archaellum component FlaC
MLNAPLVENNMFNTLAFSKKMQNVGMTQEVAEELASTLFNLHLNQFENLLTKKEFSRFEGEIKKEIDGVKHEIDGVKHEIDGVKREIDGVKHEIDGVKHEIDGVKREMENFVTKKEFYAETKNLSLNLTIKMGIIMTAGIGVLSLLLKL